MNSNEIPDDINFHMKTWGKNAEDVIYGGRGLGDDYNGYDCKTRNHFT